ncbi:ribonuclease H-like domain-containing protein [Tanacetum coccineum]
MTQAAIRKLVADSVTTTLEAQVANMANTDNTTRPREAHVARQCSYKEFTRYQPINFKGMEGAIGLIRWFERTGLVFSRSNCTKDCKVKFATGTLTEEAISWWNSLDQPIGIEEAYKITWVEFKKLLIKKYCPRTEVHKMEDEFYHLTVKGNNLKTYVRRFLELATLCPTMGPDFEKMMEVFIGGLPRSIEWNIVTTSRYVIPTGRVNVPAGRYVVPTSKDNVIVSTGRKKVIPAGRTILVLVVLCLLRVDRIVAITLKTKGGLDYLSFDDLYNKLRTLEIDVKGGSSYDSRGTSAPTHSAFISAASTNSKMSYPDQSHSTTFTSASSSPAASSNVIENVLHSFVAESDPQQQITYEDFDQIRKLDLEELDIKWQMAMLSVRINRFEKKAGRKMKFNNKDAARFDKKKVKCYKCSELGHFARECTGKQLDSKARYSSFKLKELDKSEEPKALLSVDSMLNWSDHKGEDVENGAAQVYGMIAGAEDDAAGSATGDATGDVADDVSNAAAEFALMGISSQVHTCPFGCEHLYAELKKEFDNLEVQYKECYIQVQAYKSTLQTLEQQKGWYQSNQLALEERIRILTANLENTTNMLKYTEKLNEQAKLEKLNDKVKLEESNARFDKWKESSKNLVKLINSSMSSRSKFGLGFGDTFGSDEVFDLSAPSIFDSSPKDVAEKPLYDRFVKAVGMHDVFFVNFSEFLVIV